MSHLREAIRNRLALLLIPVMLVVPAAAGGQTTTESRSVELLALGRFGGQAAAGAQVEYALTKHIVPWVSARYGWYGACDLLSECPSHLVSALGGIRFRSGPVGPFEPYATLGLGRSWWRGSSRSEATGTANIGAVWFGLGRVRPRLEFGYEGHSAGIALGVGIALR